MPIIHSWDTAIKAGAAHDASCCLIFAMDEQASSAKHRLMDAWVGKAEYPELKRTLLRLAERDAPEAILLEDTASGQSLLQDVRRETSLPLIGVQPKGDKITRFARITPMVEAGMVALPKAAPWLAAFEAELLAFPMGVHDDQVDAFSQYLNWVREREWMRGAQLRML